MGRDFGFSAQECRILSRLSTPARIQDYVDKLRYNLEEKGDTYYSPRLVMRRKEADCIEAAVFAAAALRFHGNKPLLIDLTASREDSDHVLAVFRRNGRWGALGKSKYTFFAYREPVYKSIRELALSYFELYFNVRGKKTMRSFSRRPLNLAMFDGKKWMTTEEPVHYIAVQLDRIPHEKVMNDGMARRLRIVPTLDREAGELWIRRKGLLKELRRDGY
jgi:hypothetical protein